ncbi:hypothetical protein [Mesorhizobium sp. WSM4887]|uniref:hypothetical protein n=1 Tax=Mesorhizobium sp. WSM4887 TaxID=3038543 RepID=UPI002415B507|nr:hypothetical protein [Mesorhizobium sp. WSM4887]MDG4885752.1 hypothetical protein [Mesorhizobium sp. WSM4887]
MIPQNDGVSKLSKHTGITEAKRSNWWRSGGFDWNSLVREAKILRPGSFGRPAS